MKKKFRHFVILSSTIFISINSFAQVIGILGNDTAFLHSLSKIHYRLFDTIEKPMTMVNDFEGLFTMKQQDELEGMVRKFRAETGIEIAIVTIDSTYTTKDKFDEFTLHLANKWGVGQKGKDNGILIGISRGLGKIRIQNGKGIEKILSDEETKKIIDNYFILFFKTGDYYHGTLTGLKELLKLLREKNSIK